MKTQNALAMVALLILSLTSCIKEYPDCSERDIQSHKTEILANTTLNIFLEGKNLSKSETSLENMTVLIFNNNKQLLSSITVNQEMLEEGDKKGEYCITIPTATGYHFFYVLGNTPENRTFENGDHFNDIIGNIMYDSHQMFVSVNSPRTLLKEGDNTIYIDLIRQ